MPQSNPGSLQFPSRQKLTGTLQSALMTHYGNTVDGQATQGNPCDQQLRQQKVEKAKSTLTISCGGNVSSTSRSGRTTRRSSSTPRSKTFRALATAADLYSAVDLASDKIDAQLKKYKERLKNRHKTREEEPGPEAKSPRCPCRFQSSSKRSLR